MRVGIISDIHGNSLALEVGLSKLAAMSVDRVYCLGDTVGYLPWEVEVLSRLERDGVCCQLGNHEGMLLSNKSSNPSEEIYRLGSARRRLSGHRLAWIATWPQSRQVRFGSQRILLVHGSPKQPLDGYVYPDTDLSEYGNLPFDGVFMGHTHRPFISNVGSSVFANVGSVGLPRDHGGMGAFAVYDSDSCRCHIYRFLFDVEALLAECRDLAPTVRQCLTRKPGGEIVGEILE